MELILSYGILLAFALVVFTLIKWWNVECIGPTPVHLYTFIAILFTSGLDVGLIMFPLTEFGGYADNPAYAFTNPLAVEFGFWGFMIWAFYFLTSFYFCVVEPRVQFFEIPAVKVVNNIVIIGTCAFTASLFLVYLPSYIPEVGDGTSVVLPFYVLVFAVVCAAVYSSTDIKYVRILSLSSTYMFGALILGIWLWSGMGVGGFLDSSANIGSYFAHIHNWVLPMTDYHAFYLFWWFAWSIMIGQFTSRFVGGLKTWQLFIALLVIPSIPLAIWFAVLYGVHLRDLPTTGLVNVVMVIVGITFVINSLDSLIRLYTDNLSLTVARFGKPAYMLGNIAALYALTLLFQNQWLQIQWIGAVVVGIYTACVVYILARRRNQVAAIDSSPTDRALDFDKIETVH